jgi:hypothetical protein
MAEGGYTSRYRVQLSYASPSGGETLVDSISYPEVALDFDSEHQIVDKDFLIRAGKAKSYVKVNVPYSTHKHGAKNCRFDYWSDASNAKEWSRNAYGSPSVTPTIQRTDLGSGDYVMDIQGYYNAGEFLADGVIINSGSSVNGGDVVQLNWKFVMLADSPQARIAVQIVNGSDNWFLQNDGTWVQTSTPTVLAVGNTPTGVYVNVIQTPYSGTIKLWIFKPSHSSGSLGGTGYYQRVYWADIIVYNSPLTRSESFSNDYNSFDRVFYNNKKFINEPEEVVMLGYDYEEELPLYNVTALASDVVKNELIGIIRNPTTGLPISGGFNSPLFYDTDKTLAYQIGFLRARLAYQNNWIIEGTFYCDTLAIGQTYTADLLGVGEKKFVCVAYEWDVKSSLQRYLLVECTLADADTASILGYLNLKTDG